MNVRQAYRRFVDHGQWDHAARLVAALEDEAILRERIEIETWVEPLLAESEVTAGTHAAILLGIAANGAMVRGDLEHARALAVQAHDAMDRGAAPSYVASNVRFLISVIAEVSETGAFGGGRVTHLRRLHEYSESTGDPLGAALAEFDDVLARTTAGRATEGAAAAVRLKRLGRATRSPLVESMAHLCLAWVRSAINPGRAADHTTDAIALARRARCTLVRRHAERTLESLRGLLPDADHQQALVDAMARVTGAAQLGQREQTLQEIVALVPILVALGQWREAAYVVGMLDRSIWTGSNVVRRERERLITLLGRAEFDRYSRPGRRASWTELVPLLETRIAGITPE
ncbi:MAG: hypothetical protein R2715_23625 [Ilumatobacteraceae bacterium]